MDKYYWIHVCALLGLTGAKRIGSAGLIKYGTVQRRADKTRTFSAVESGSIHCAVMCSRMVNCDYYLLVRKDRFCRHHKNRKQIFVPQPISTIHWTVNCGKPPRASHGHYKVAEKVAHYTCNNQFKLLGTNDIRCLLFWPPAPKCRRYIWKNPIFEWVNGVQESIESKLIHDYDLLKIKDDFNAKIPWGFEEGGSIFLSGRPTLKDKSFVIFIGVKKTSKKRKENDKFLLHMEVKVSTTQKQNITLHTGSMKTKAVTWTPDIPLYSVHNITDLTINLTKNGLKITINRLPFKNNAKIPKAIQYENIKIISLFNRFKVELLKVDTNN